MGDRRQAAESNIECQPVQCRDSRRAKLSDADAHEALASGYVYRSVDRDRDGVRTMDGTATERERRSVRPSTSGRLPARDPHDREARARSQPNHRP